MEVFHVGCHHARIISQGTHNPRNHGKASRPSRVSRPAEKFAYNALCAGDLSATINLDRQKLPTDP
jgi:hypothetical protein